MDERGYECEHAGMAACHRGCMKARTRWRANMLLLLQLPAATVAAGTGLGVHPRAHFALRTARCAFHGYHHALPLGSDKVIVRLARWLLE